MPEHKKEQRVMEIRAVQQPPDSTDMLVEGRAIIFNSPTVMYEYDGMKFYEVIDSKALDGCDMSDVVFRYNHSDNVMIMARTRKGSLQLIKDDLGLNVKAKLFDITPARDLYSLIQQGAIDEMSFQFVVAEDSYNQDTRTRTISKIKKLYDVAAVDMGAYSDTSISARSWAKAEAEREHKAMEIAELRKRVAERRAHPPNMGQAADATCQQTCCVMCKQADCNQRMECCQACMMCCKSVCKDCEQTCKMGCCALCHAQCQTLCAGCSKVDCSMHTVMSERKVLDDVELRKRLIAKTYC